MLRSTFSDNLRIITQEGNMKTTQITDSFHLLFLFYLLVTFIFEFKKSILVYKIPQFFCQKLLIWTTHHTFLESRHPEDTKNLYYVLFTCQSKIQFFFRLQLVNFIGGWRKFHKELVCFVITFLVTKKVRFRSPFDMHFHSFIIEFFWFG